MTFQMTSMVKTITTLVAAFAMAAVLAGCNVQQAGVSTDEHAAENRQYMALLNQKTGELDDVLSQFQVAVSAGDPVGMKAAASDASKIVEEIANTETTESLAEVKDSYVLALQDIDTALGDYTGLYTDVSSGKIDQAEFESMLKSVQSEYDQALNKLTAADELLTELANE